MEKIGRQIVLTDIFLIRHATPDRSTRIPYRVAPGPGLTAAGKDEARQAGRFLANKAIEHLFVSPFTRTSETAEQLVAIIGLPVTFTRLIEENSIDEDHQRVQRRTSEFLHSLDEAAFQRVGIVSHGWPIRQMLIALTHGQVHLDSYCDQNGNPLPPAGIWHARRQNGVWHAHLAFCPAAEL
jgi:2,3-bisphosphoglycerate-dependent phosphoglycerate mutase